MAKAVRHFLEHAPQRKAKIASTIRERCWPITVYERLNSGAYCVPDFKITVQPSHGVASVINHRLPQGDDGGVCKGRLVNVRRFIYRPAANYSGQRSYFR
jgi:hypothetical protein